MPSARCSASLAFAGMFQSYGSLVVSQVHYIWRLSPFGAIIEPIAIAGTLAESLHRGDSLHDTVHAIHIAAEFDWQFQPFAPVATFISGHQKMCQNAGMAATFYLLLQAWLLHGSTLATAVAIMYAISYICVQAILLYTRCRPQNPTDLFTRLIVLRLSRRRFADTRLSTLMVPWDIRGAGGVSMLVAAFVAVIYFLVLLSLLPSRPHLGEFAGLSTDLYLVMVAIGFTLPVTMPLVCAVGWEAVRWLGSWTGAFAVGSCVGVTILLADTYSPTGTHRPSWLEWM